MLAVIASADSEARDLYEFSLRKFGLDVRHARSLEQSIATWEEGPADLLLSVEPAETNLPELIRNFRQQSPAPLVIIQENAPLSQQLAAVKAGADLFWAQAIDPRLCAATCVNLLRRSTGLISGSLPSLTLAGLTLDPSTRTFRLKEDDPIRLTQLEFKLLYLLMSYNGQVIPTEVIVEKVWGYDDFGSSDLVRGLVSRLRTKLDDFPEKPRFIETIAGVGYRFRPDA